jgi:hypothetical protein
MRWKFGAEVGNRPGGVTGQRVLVARVEMIWRALSFSIFSESPTTSAVIATLETSGSDLETFGLVMALRLPFHSFLVQDRILVTNSTAWLASTTGTMLLFGDDMTS